MTSPLATLAAHCREIDLSERGGVYILVDGEDIAYVGSAVDVYARIGQHRHRFNFDRAFIFPTPKRGRRAIEGALIRALAPRYTFAAPTADEHRDASILSRLGLTLNPEAKSAFESQRRGCWSRKSPVTPERRAVYERARQRRRSRCLFARLDVLFGAAS